MDNMSLKRLLIVKELRLKLAKESVFLAGKKLREVEERIKILKQELIEEKNNSKIRQHKELEKILSKNFNATSYAVVYSIFAIGQENISQILRWIAKENETKEQCKRELEEAQRKLKAYLQQEQKISHIGDIIERNEIVRSEIISDGT